MKPGLSNVVRCLNSLSDVEPRSISYVCKKAHINRNFVSALLKTCTSFSLVIPSIERRSEKFTLTPKANAYLRILLGDFRSVSEEIKKISAAADSTAASSTPVRDVADQFLLAIGTRTGEPTPPYFELQTLTDAFTIASSGYFEDTPEYHVFTEIASLLKAGSAVFSKNRQLRRSGKAFLRKASETLESIGMAKEMIDINDLGESTLSLEQIAEDGRGRPIYRVK